MIAVIFSVNVVTKMLQSLGNVLIYYLMHDLECLLFSVFELAATSRSSMTVV